MFINLNNRLPRALSSFNHVTHCWAPISLPVRDPYHPITQGPSSYTADTTGKQSLTLTTWNIQASWPDSASRSKLILNHILKETRFPDIIHLQEVTLNARQSLLDDPRVRSGFLTTDAEDETSFKGRTVPIATMTLLSNKRFGSSLLDEEGERRGKLMLKNVFRLELPSRFKRDALCVEIVAPTASDSVFRVFNVHLDSLHSHSRRALQMGILAGLLREPTCRGGIIAGDFNAIFPEDHKLVDEHELLDAWIALRGSTGSDGATWGAGMEDGPKAGRLDKVVMLGLKPDEIEVLQPGLVEPRSWPWTDHCGLRCTFTI